MSRRGSYRHHSAAFALQVCTDIRAGIIGRLKTHKHHDLSANLIQHWLVQYDRGKRRGEEAEASQAADYESKIAARERKVGQLTMEIDLLKNASATSRAEQRRLLDRELLEGCSIRPGCDVIESRNSYYHPSTATDTGLSDERLASVTTKFMLASAATAVGA